MKQVKLLCTGSFKTNRVLPASVVLEVKPFIESFFLNKETEIKNALATYNVLIFTSAMAVKAVEKVLDRHADKAYKIYCIESNTSQKVAEVFGETAIAGKAAYGADLADIIIEKETSDKLFFFCGNLRRDVLPQKLKKVGKHLEILEVYKTVDKIQEIKNAYDGYLFFSPSAVESFFKQYPHAKTGIYFAIGTTTQEALEKYVETEKIIISATPEKELLLDTAIEYFNF